MLPNQTDTVAGRETFRVGDWLVVHTGLAVEVLDPDEAARIRDARAELHAPEGGTGQ